LGYVQHEWQFIEIFTVDSSAFLVLGQIAEKAAIVRIASSKPAIIWPLPIRKLNGGRPQGWLAPVPGPTPAVSRCLPEMFPLGESKKAGVIGAKGVFFRAAGGGWASPIYYF
jgi:hypothetical protein